jgi:DNA polymerase I-like protein with 3'-5' exonuclease and polymerase domains
VFQGLAADASKEAIWRLYKTRERMVNMVHDEIICELPLEDIDSMNERVHCIERAMVEAMRKVTPDVLVKAESTLMDRWLKADGIRDDKGRLIVMTETDSKK